MMPNKTTQPLKKRLKPNRALRQVRTINGLSQAAFAKLLGVSTPYVQAIELGQRAASIDFAERVRDHTGASPRCILDNSSTAVDVSGNRYTAKSAASPIWELPAPRTVDDSLRRFLEPICKILDGASTAGKSSIALSLVRDKLCEAATRIFALDGVAEATERELSEHWKVSTDEREIRCQTKSNPLRGNDLWSEAMSTLRQHPIGNFRSKGDLFQPFLPPTSAAESLLKSCATAKNSDVEKRKDARVSAHVRPNK